MGEPKNKKYWDWRLKEINKLQNQLNEMNMNGQELLKKANGNIDIIFNWYYDLADANRKMGYCYNDLIDSVILLFPSDLKPNPDMIKDPYKYRLPEEPQYQEWPWKN
ncbi:MAG: hypothetical protein ABSB79_04245 [Syntrophales bacterium]|jgi:hypothetical protein